MDIQTNGIVELLDYQFENDKTYVLQPRGGSLQVKAEQQAPDASDMFIVPDSVFFEFTKKDGYDLYVRTNPCQKVTLIIG